MKIRHGFVSNSSTTSFCIYGISLTEDQRDAIENVDEDAIIRGEEYSWYLGHDWKTIGDDQTGGEFKSNVRSYVMDMFQRAGLSVNGLSFDTHEEAWRDG